MNLVAVIGNLMKVIGRRVSTLSSEVWVQVELRNLFALCDNELFKIRGWFVRVYISKHLRPCTFDQIVVKFEIQKVYKRVFPLVSCSSIHLALCPGSLQAASNQTLKPVILVDTSLVNSSFQMTEGILWCTKFTSAGFLRGLGGAFAPPSPLECGLPPLGYAENFILYVNQLYTGFNDTINFV